MHVVELKRHGNSKGKKPFSYAKPSVLHHIKESAQIKAPLKEIKNIQGGVMGAKSACGSHSRADVLAHVIKMCGVIRI